MNKKAGPVGDMLVSPSILIAIIIIAVGVSLSLIIFYGNGFDGRQADADALRNKIETCFSKHSISEIKSNFYATCGINENVLSNRGFIFKVCETGNLDDCVNSPTQIATIGSNFPACFFTGAKNNNAYPKCSSSVIDKESKSFSIITGSNQKIRVAST